MLGIAMDSLEPLIADLLAWIGTDGRPYREVMDAWRTSCPALPVWEEATERGFILRSRTPDQGAFVSVSPAGAHWLRGRSRAA
jgi:hypothetical protein